MSITNFFRVYSKLWKIKAIDVQNAELSIKQQIETLAKLFLHRQPFHAAGNGAYYTILILQAISSLVKFCVEDDCRAGGFHFTEHSLN